MTSMYDYLTVLILFLQIIVGGVAEKIIVCVSFEIFQNGYKKKTV